MSELNIMDVLDENDLNNTGQINFVDPSGNGVSTDGGYIRNYSDATLSNNGQLVVIGTNITSGSVNRSPGVTVRGGDVYSGATVTSQTGGMTMRSGRIRSGGTGPATGNASISSGHNQESSNASDTGSAQLYSGDNDGAGTTGEVNLYTGEAANGDSGDISLVIGPASGTQGSVIIVDGSEGTSGDVWTSAGIGGEGNWQTPSAGGDLWSDTVDSKFTPDIAYTHDIGTTSKQFRDLYARNAIFGSNTQAGQVFASDGTDNAAILLEGKTSTTMPSGAIGRAGILSTQVAGPDLGIHTANNASVDAVATNNVYIETGNKTAGTGDSGDIVVQPGSSVGGSRGKIVSKDGSEGTVGHVWTSTDTSGAGNWAVSTGTSTKTIQSKTAAYTMLTSDDVGLGNTTTTAFSFTLPTAVGNEGKEFDFKHTGTDYSKFLTLDGDGTETIDGSTTYVLRIPKSGVKIISDNANWQILEEYRPPNRIEERILAGDVNGDGTIAAWTFNNLVTGTHYHITGVMTLVVDDTANNPDVYIDITHNSGVIGRVRNRIVESSDTSGDTLTFHISVKFEAAASSLTFVSASTSSSSHLVGNNTKNESFIQLEELSRTETTTDF